MWVVMGLEIDDPVDPVALGDAFADTLAMLPGARGKVARHADVQNATRPTRRDVDMVDLV